MHLTTGKSSESEQRAPWCVALMKLASCQTFSKLQAWKMASKAKEAAFLFDDG